MRRVIRAGGGAVAAVSLAVIPVTAGVPGAGFEAPASTRLAVAGFGVAAVATAHSGGAHRPAGRGAQLWARRFAGGGGAHAIVVSPTGAVVFVIGDKATVAYNAGTGARLWVRHAGGVSAAVSASGRTVFVTGLAASQTGSTYATAAYRAATGARLWLRRYPGGTAAASVAVSPNGRIVFVTGSGPGALAFDYVTVAYRAATGARLWARHYHGPVLRGSDGGGAIAASPSGRAVFVFGQVDQNYGTLAYNARTGAQLWVRRYNGGRLNLPRALGVSPTGRRVFVTGLTGTVAYNAAAAGKKLWVSRFASANFLTMAVSPTGKTVFVAGSTGPTTVHYIVVAYNAATGARLWARRYIGPGHFVDVAYAVAVSPTGKTVYVTGGSSGRRPGLLFGYATVAYDAATGAQLWVRRFHGPGNADDNAHSVAVSPDGTTVFVTGESAGDYLTVAYKS